MKYVLTFVFQKAKDFQIGPKDVKEKKTIHVFLGKLVWLISAARNIIVVVVSAVMAYLFEAHGAHPFILTGGLKSKSANPASVANFYVLRVRQTRIADVFSTTFQHHRWKYNLQLHRHDVNNGNCDISSASALNSRKHSVGEGVL